MPDKIKEVYELISDNGYFKDENEFRQYVADPKRRKEAFELIKDDGFFKDETEFDSYFNDPEKKKSLSFGSELPYGSVQKTLPNSPLIGTKNTSQSKSPSTSIPTIEQAVKGASNNLTPEQMDVPVAAVPAIKAASNAQDEKLVNQRQKLTFLNAENNLKKQRIEKIGGINSMVEEIGLIDGELEKIIAQSPDGKNLPTNLYSQYNSLLQERNNKASELEKLTGDVEKTYDASNVLMAGIRNVDKQYQNILEKNFDTGTKVVSAFKQVNNNLVNSASKLVQTVGDLNYQLNESLGLGDVFNEPDYENKVTDKISKGIDDYYATLEKGLNTTLPKSYKEYSPFSDKPELDKLFYFGLNSTAQLAPTIGAALVTGGGSLAPAATGFAMEFGDIYETFHRSIKNKYIEQGLTEQEADKKADLEAGLMATTGAGIIGALDKWGAGGLIDAFSKKALIKKVAKDAIENMGGKVGRDISEAAIKKSLKQNLVNFGKGYGKAVLPEVVGEPIQELVAPAMADVYDVATGTETFGEETLANKQTWINAANAGLGALMASSPAGIGSGYKNISNPSTYEMAMKVVDGDDFEAFTKAVQKEVNGGLTTPEMGEMAIANVKRIQEADKLIPQNITDTKQRANAVALLLEREDITAEIEGKDKSLTLPQQERLTEINTLLGKVSKGEDIEQEEQIEITNEVQQPNTVPTTDVGAEPIGAKTAQTELGNEAGAGNEPITVDNTIQEPTGEPTNDSSVTQPTTVINETETKTDIKPESTESNVGKVKSTETDANTAQNEKPSEVEGPTFERVPILTTTAEEVETAKNEVFNNLSRLEVGSVIENSDGEIKVVTEKSTDKKGNQLIGVVTYERQSDGSLRQMTNIVWASKSADGKIKLDYNPHSTGTNLKGERVTVTDQITDKKIDLSKENIFTEDENGNLVQINKSPTETKTEVSSQPEGESKLNVSLTDEGDKVEAMAKLERDLSSATTTSKRDSILVKMDELNPLKIENITPESDPGKMTKSVIAALKRAEGYDADTRNKMADKIGEFYNTQSQEKLEQIGQGFIDAYGSLDAATKEAMDESSGLPPTVRTFILGQAILNAKKAYTAAASEAEKNKWLDRQNDYWDALDKYMRESGRAISYLQKLYAKSPIAVARKMKKEIEQHNKMMQPQAEKQSGEIKDIISDDSDLKETINEAVDQALTGTNEAIIALQKEIDELRKKLSGRKGSVSNPINLGVTKEQVSAARKRLLAKTYSNAFLNPEFWKDMGILAADAIQEGSRKVADFYAYLNKSLGGKYKEAYGELYTKAKAKAIEQGAKESEFTADEEIQAEIDAIEKETEAEKIAKLTALKAKLSALRNNETIENDDSKEYKEAVRLSKLMDSLSKKADEIRAKEKQKVLDNIEKERLKKIQNEFKEVQKKEEEARLAVSKAAENATKERISLEEMLQKEQERIAKIREDEKQKVLDNIEKYRLQRAKKEHEERIKKLEAEHAEKMREEKKRLKEVQRQFNAPKVAAEKIINDANKELNNESTKKEKDALSSVIELIVKKAKDFTVKGEKPIGKTTADIISFALGEQSRSEKIWTEAQKEVFEKIDSNPDLTDTQKQELKDFLAKYKAGVFDVLLTNGQKNKIIREKLIQAGYSIEKNGKTIMSVEPIIARSRTVEQAVDSIMGIIAKETGFSESELAEFKKSLEARLTDIVAEKKAAKVNAYLERNAKYRAARLLGKRSRKTRVQKLIELYNSGGLTNSKVKSELAEELGVIEFTQEDEVWLANKFEEADAAPVGAELEKIEEEIQAYLEAKGAGLFGKEFWNRMTARLLGNPFTMIKNLSGGLETVFQTVEKVIKTNKHLINPAKWKQGFDTNTLRVIRNAHSSAFHTAMDILINGGVDLGTALSEQTGTKEGTPRVRYIEYAKRLLPDLYVQLGGSKYNLNVVNSLLNSEKYIGRLLSFPDTFNQVLLQEMKTYSYIKNKYLANDPLMTQKEASQKAFDILYNQDLEAQRAKIIDEFKKRGITLDLSNKKDIYRFNRRVYESVMQQREQDVLQVASSFASRYTYKEGDVGIMSPVKKTLNGIKKGFKLATNELREEGKKDPDLYRVYNATANTIDNSVELLFNTHLPFIQGVANILEKGLELYPLYGAIKSVGYLAPAVYLDKVKNNQKGAEELYSRSGEAIIRASIGLALTALLLSFADDDEDDKEKALYGSGDEDYKKAAAIKTVRPANTIVINGRNINLDYLGSMGVSLKAEAAMTDIKRYSEKFAKMNGVDRAAAETMAVLKTVVLGSYTQGLYDLLNGGIDPKAKAAEFTTRAVIPWVGSMRSAYQLIDSKAKKPVTFAESLAKYSGMVAGWSVNRLAFDYRGREYSTGQIYSGSPDAFVGMLSGMEKNSDRYDHIIMQATDFDMSYTNLNKRDPENYVIDNNTGKTREMTNEEYYEVSKLKNQTFNDMAVTYIDEQEKMRDNNNSSLFFLDKKAAKSAMSQINTAAKTVAFKKLFNEVTYEIEQ